MSAEIRREIAKLNNFILSDRIDRKVLSAVHSQTAKRIFSDSKHSDGANLGSKLNYKSPKKGAYSESYANKRIKKGRPINKITLQFSGSLLKDWKLMPVANNQYGSGFSNIDLDKVSRKLEELYNGNIFSELTEEEERLIETLYAQELERNFR